MMHSTILSSSTEILLLFYTNVQTLNVLNASLTTKQLFEEFAQFVKPLMLPLKKYVQPAETGLLTALRHVMMEIQCPQMDAQILVKLSKDTPVLLHLPHQPVPLLVEMV